MSNPATYISDLYYFPPLSWYVMAQPAAVIQMDVHAHYQKGSWRNRCYIAGPHGLQLLSVPLERGKNERRPFKDVKISQSERWQQQHWRTLEACYRRSAYFEFFEDDLAPFYQRPYTFLLDWNLDLLRFTFKPLKMAPDIIMTTSYQPFQPDNPFDIRAQNTKDTRHAALGATLAPYQQVFGERYAFLPNLSILDHLFNKGLSAIEKNNT
ncbi:MAG TPA: hypothetical protein DHW15_00430 [Bacteroidetes bacterium]|nr:hypothetical protein [Bacteroidota bacterium]